MIFSDSEREYYRKELEAACKAGDVKRTKRLIDQIRLLGDIRDAAPILGDIQDLTDKANELLKIKSPPPGIQEYIKHQSMIKKEKDREDKPVINSGGLLEFLKTWTPEDLPTIDMSEWAGTPDENPYGTLPAHEKDALDDILDRCFLGDDDIALTDRAEMPFRGVLQQGFKDSGWTW